MRFIVMTAAIFFSSAAVAADMGDYTDSYDYYVPSYQGVQTGRGIAPAFGCSDPSNCVPRRIIPSRGYASPSNFDPTNVASQCARNAASTSYTIRVEQKEKSFSVTCSID